MNQWRIASGFFNARVHQDLTNVFFWSLRTSVSTGCQLAGGGGRKLCLVWLFTCQLPAGERDITADW